MNATRTVIPRGTVYFGGQPHGFPPRTELRLPEPVADALDAAGHTVSADELANERAAAETPKA